jgi:flagellar motor switch protein FliG
MDEDTKTRLLSELSRIDHLPRDYVFNVANSLKIKRKENPRLNTEALPGSEVLINLLERASPAMQRQVVRTLESTNPESARNLKGKLVSIDTLRFLRDGQLLEVVLSLKHDELLQFLKGAPADIRDAVFAKSPKELIAELEDELTSVGALSREVYSNVERKILNRMKIMANDGIINLNETNDRMFQSGDGYGFVQSGPATAENGKTSTAIGKVAGW